jgi:hypothetical protein
VGALYLLDKVCMWNGEWKATLHRKRVCYSIQQMLLTTRVQYLKSNHNNLMSQRMRETSILCEES